MEQKMQAIAFRRYGTVEVLETLETERPIPRSGQVLIRVIAAGVNPADWVLRSGQLRFFARLKFPFIPGSDVAGIVTAMGPGTGRFRPGDAVYGMFPSIKGGGYAQYVAVAEDVLAPIPPQLTYVEAAAVPLASLTALQALRDQGQVAHGSSVLIYGASGGVGSFAVQIARNLGAHVTAACSTGNIELVKSLGAKAVIDYTRNEITASDTHYDVIFDAAGAFPFKHWRPILKPKGLVVSINLNFANPLQTFLSCFESTGKRLKGVFVRPSGDDLTRLSAWISTGKLRPVIEQSFPLLQAAQAQRRSESRRVRGKLVLVVDEKLAQTTVEDEHCNNRVRQWEGRELD
ncbi:NAD(P)-dependent alcohol dehydrogenase [Dictyobacter aurantiacus]|uniref:NADPH:quinone reductase n=1 Tax=Dictyobacter aurantiacus TaxID=1936993 RepID=A0A401ZAE6_9CHLR|nr:NAD(P)-dependent alcohol dehydrogenase [Dictyobacter aurantiacus]GCE03840.1 NADPH:quinone reductase [Dictyobacter aurantiacus]